MVEHHLGGIVERHLGRGGDQVAVIHWRTRASLVCMREAMPWHVPLREDADQAAEVLHDDRADVLLHHLLRHLAERVLGRDGDEFGFKMSASVATGRSCSCCPRCACPLISLNNDR